MKTEVVSVMSRNPRPDETYYRPDLFMASLKRFGVEPTILGFQLPWWGLMSKPRYVRQWLREGRCKSDALIVSDAFDVVFLAHPDKVGEKWGGGDEILFNCERGLFPRGDLAHAFPDTGSPWRYLNSGLMIGKTANILALLEAMTLDDIHDDHPAPDDLHGQRGQMVHPNDQGHFQYAYAARPVPMTLDTQCELFQTLSACDASEFDVDETGFTNKITGTRPLVAHFNGSSKNDLLPGMIQTWGLA